MEISKPKVLILNQPFVLNSGGGVTLSNLLAAWPKNKLAVACLGHLLEGKLDREICDNYYQIGQLEYKWVFPFNLVNRKYPSGPVELKETQITTVGVKKSSFRVKFIMDYFFPFLEYMGILHSLSKMELSDSFKKWLDELAPDVIYAQAPTRQTLNLCIAVQEYLNIPLIYHVMDDWPSTIGQKGFLKKFWQKTIHKEFMDLLNRSSALMSISDYMSKAYMERYGQTFTPFHNPIDVKFWKQYQRQSYHVPDNPQILYAGRIGLGIQQSLETIALAIDRVNDATLANIALVIQTGSQPDWIDKYQCTEYRSFVAYEELPRVFAEADLLVLPYDFSVEANQFIKYSMPTKAPEYMASGTPILIFSPEDTAIVRYAQAYGWAEVVTENDMNVLAKSIQKMILDESHRIKIAEKGIAIAEDRHDAEMVSKQFQDIITTVAAKAISRTVAKA